MRPIDADALNTAVAVFMAENAYLNMTALDALKMVAGWISEAPTIGAVPVVRCRECIYYKICDEWETGKRMLCEIHHHSYLDHDGDEHFCSWGQRREAEHDKHPSDPL